MECTSCAGRADAFGGDYLVRAGDTLSELAQSRGVRGGADTLYARNNDVLVDKHHIYVGQRLRVGTAAARAATCPVGAHVVMAGETLSQIAQDHHVSGGAAALLAANRSTLVDADHIYTGQRLALGGPVGRSLPPDRVTVSVVDSSGDATFFLGGGGVSILVTRDAVGPPVIRVNPSPSAAGYVRISNRSLHAISVRFSRGSKVLEPFSVGVGATTLVRLPA